MLQNTTIKSWKLGVLIPRTIIDGWWGITNKLNFKFKHIHIVDEKCIAPDMNFRHLILNNTILYQTKFILNNIDLFIHTATR